MASLSSGQVQNENVSAKMACYLLSRANRCEDLFSRSLEKLIYPTSAMFRTNFIFKASFGT